MKYMLLMGGTQADYAWYASWGPEDFARHGAFMQAFSAQLQAEGKLIGTEGLDFPHEARIVKAGSDGEPVTDGIFPETKEFLAGYFLIEVSSPEEAYRIAARLSAQPAPGNRGPAPIEVRRVLSGQADLSS